MPYVARAHQLTQSLLYHIFNRGNARSEIFHHPQDYQQLIILLSNYSKRYNLRIYHWALMPNHYHLLLEIDKPEKLSSIMAGLGRAYVHHQHKTYSIGSKRFLNQLIKEKGLFLPRRRGRPRK